MPESGATPINWNGGPLASMVRMMQIALAADPRDGIIIRYTKGKGRFSPDKKYITLDMKMYDEEFNEDGSHQGVWHALFNHPEELLQVPPMPSLPLNEPVGPVAHIDPVTQTKAIWTFGDGSSITAVGPAMSNLVPLADGSFVFMVTCAQIITNGTGRYEGVYGVKQSLGATFIPVGVDFFGSKSGSFEATTVETFRIVRRRYYRAPPDPASVSPAEPAGPPQPASPSAAGDDSGPASKEISSAYPFSPKQLNIFNSNMSYIDEGHGDPILFLHGNPTWSYLWRNILPYLIPLGRCIAPDLIGMGRSEKPDINYNFFTHYKYLDELIQKLGLDRITLVLHDWGSSLGFHYANLNRAKIKGIAFMEAVVKPWDTWAEFPAKSAPAELRDAFRTYRGDKGFDLIVKQNLFVKQAEAAAGRPLSPEEISNYEKPFQTEKSREVILTLTRQLPIEGDPADVVKAHAEYSKYLQQSDVPKLLFYTEGGLVFKEQVEWCRHNLSRLETVNLEPPTEQPPIHIVQEKYPHEIGEAIANWYKGLSS